jgi:parallel beta helix pectate lyase-like protein
MQSVKSFRLQIVCWAAVVAAFSQTASAKTLCVNPSASHSCYGTINEAVTAASSYDVITVAAGTYTEDVVIGKPLSLLGAGPGKSIIDATGLANGILMDGLDNPGLRNVLVTGFTVKNALYEGILVLNTSAATVQGNQILNNDKEGPVFGSGPACNGQPAYETDESGDCGGAIHLLGAVNSLVSGNYISGNADGVLISDDTAESHGNLITNNIVIDNPLECGIVLASHAPAGSTPPHFAAHYGVDHNAVSQNISANNGVQVGGAGAGLFSDGEGPGRVSENVISWNVLTGNGIPGVALHTHVGPAFGAPADNMSGNSIIGNYIAGNGADTADTATPGRTGINISSGGGGSPVTGTIISLNVIRDEEVDIAVNTPNEVDAHFNELLGGDIGVANVCSFDMATACTGTIDATENYWGCAAGPGGKGCSTISGPDISFLPFLRNFY